MLGKLNAYRNNRKAIRATRQNNTYIEPEKLVFELASDLRSIREIQKFRAEVFGADFGIEFPDNIDRDLFDLDCEHAVVKVAQTGKIVAYSRFYKLPVGQYHRCYTEQEFAIQELLQGKPNVVEIGRTCVHPNYREGKALSKLWMGMLPYVLGNMNAKWIIGCVSVSIGKSELRALKTHALMQQLDAGSVVQATSRKPYTPQRLLDTTLSEQDFPSLFRHYLGMQAKFSKEAYFDEDFNCLDYFSILEVSEMAKSFILNFGASKK